MPDRVADPQLLDTTRHLRILIEGVHDYLLLVLDLNGTIVSWTGNVENIKGYATDDIVGRHFTYFYTPEDIKNGKPEQELRVATESGRFEEIGIRVGKDGTRFSANVIITPIRNESGSLIGFGELTHDITNRARINEQLIQAQKMEIVGQLSGGIAHDFNNLLTVIIGNADLLNEQMSTRPELSELCVAIATASMRGAELTQRLLAFSRRQTLQPLAIDCNQQVDKMQKLLRRTLRGDIDIQTSLDPMLKTALADPAQLESAILNLALNAQDAMPDGGHLTISTANAVLGAHHRDNFQEVKPGEYVLVTVSDDGEGMAPDVCKRVFEPFFTTKEVGKGSGLGLSMVYGFAKQSNGHVSLQSEVKSGTTIRLYLPVASPASAKALNHPLKIGGPLPCGSETVLIVEDDPFVLSFAVTCLKSLGYRVMTAADAREALTWLNQDATPLDVIFTDIIMPGGMSGCELAERARQIRPGIKVLLTSGYALDALAERGRPNADAFVLGKPYRKSELAVHMRSVLDAATSFESNVARTTVS